MIKYTRGSRISTALFARAQFIMRIMVVKTETSASGMLPFSEVLSSYDRLKKNEVVLMRKIMEIFSVHFPPLVGITAHGI